MDKFGIFKLLNWFFSLSGQNTSNNANDGTGENKQGAFDFSKLLTSLNNNSNNNSPEEKNPNTKTKNDGKKQANFMPLQKSMLNTMNSHDEFIKRVKEKNIRT